MSIYDRDTPVKVSFTLPRNMLEDLSTKRENGRRRFLTPLVWAAFLFSCYFLTLSENLTRKIVLRENKTPRDLYKVGVAK